MPYHLMKLLIVLALKICLKIEIYISLVALLLIIRDFMKCLIGSSRMLILLKIDVLIIYISVVSTTIYIHIHIHVIFIYFLSYIKTNPYLNFLIIIIIFIIIIIIIIIYSRSNKTSMFHYTFWTTINL